MGSRAWRWRCAAATLAAAVAAALAPATASDRASDGARERRHAANNPFRASLISACARARRPAGTAALAFDGARLPFDVVAGNEPGSRPRCRRDELRLLRLQALTIDGRRTYVRRGGCRLPCVAPQSTVHVPAGALAAPVDLLPVRARNGNGAAVGGCRERARNAPRRVGRELRRMHYKTPGELRRRRNAGRSGGDGARWSNYGDPGARYRSGGRRATHYNYLLWNLPRDRDGVLPGGGIVAAIVRERQPLALCAGERLRLPAFDRHGARNGYVDFAYARVRSERARGYAIHGWVLAGYRYRRQPFVATTSSET